jgi:hypothetical protein
MCFPLWTGDKTDEFSFAIVLLKKRCVYCEGCPQNGRLWDMHSHPEEMDGWHLALYGTLIQNYLNGFGA